MHYAFVDESGTTAPFSGGRFLVVAMLVTPWPRELDLVINRARKRFGASLPSGEMKAGSADQRVATAILGALACLEIAIICTAVDKGVIGRPPQNKEDLYTEALITALRLAVPRWPQLIVSVDSRHTSPRLREALEESLRRSVSDLCHEIPVIQQEDSVKRRGLQAAHHVAWALFQKRERGVGDYYALIADRVVAEEVISRQLW
jgi:hypothetical protein